MQAAIDVIVQVERSPNGQRRVREVTEVSMRPDVLGTKTIWCDGVPAARPSRGRR
jgi:Flp pilus assembly CpaF family ATPase